MTRVYGHEDDGLVLQTHWEPTGEIWQEVLLAEPRARFAGALLHKIVAREAEPYTTLDKAEVGGVIRIFTRDRTVIYRLIEYDQQQDVYVGEWPD